jgi:tricorn protease-like protein
MMNRRKFLLVVASLIVILACNRPIVASPTPDLFATLQASTPGSFSSPSVFNPTITPFTPLAPFPTSGTQPAGDSIPAPSSADGLTGHIVFTCQLFKVQSMDQICIMNADGSGMRRLTTENNKRHYYASLAPDGGSVVYSSYLEDNFYEIYRLRLSDGSVDRLTDKLGVLTGPEISPDGTSVIFSRGDPTTGRQRVAIMDRDGKDARNIVSGWDPTWSQDGTQILFASDLEGGVQLFIANRNGKEPRRVTSLPSLRGRSDWSPDGQWIVTYAGPSWHREVYILSVDGSNLRQLTPTGGNSQGPSFSPDGKWVAFTAYFDQYGKDHGCEIYVIRTDGTDLRRLTNNDYCDYQPRWGP